MLCIIAGKPGSGKSYHMATLLVDMLTDWVRYEIKHGIAFDSSIWINITLRIEGLNETIGKRVGQDVDVSKYIHFCESSFFNDSECTYWWTKFPSKSVIVIDEVHVYLGKKVEFGSLDLEQELINWISQHRHSQQEIYFLSQHTDQFARQILGIADTLLEIVNMKSLTLPWPISVPMSDVEELKRSFGIRTQYYQANVGNFRGKAVRWGGATHRHMMSADIFRVYKSHDAGMEESDRPSLQMTKWEGLCWFLRKHGWHLLPKFGGILAMPYVVMQVLFAIPVILMDAAMGGSSAKREAPVDKVAVEQKVVKVEKVVPPAVPVLESVVADVPVEVPLVPDVGVTALAVQPSKVVKVVMLYQNGVLLDDGRKITIGEAFSYEGETETLACACAVCGVIAFESGKRIRF